MFLILGEAVQGQGRKQRIDRLQYRKRDREREQKEESGEDSRVIKAERQTGTESETDPCMFLGQGAFGSASALEKRLYGETGGAAVMSVTDNYST